jgi:hypothetical protein
MMVYERVVKVDQTPQQSTTEEKGELASSPQHGSVRNMHVRPGVVKRVLADNYCFLKSCILFSPAYAVFMLQVIQIVKV